MLGDIYIYICRSGQKIGVRVMCYVKFCSLKTHTLLSKHHFWAIYDDQTAEVTPDDGLVRESPPKMA